MANAREILSRMNSVRDTRKITNAMYLISSNKLRKSKQMLEDTEPYFYTMQAVIQRILRHIPDIQHPYFADSRKVEEKDRSRALVVITGDKGLAGAYNHNVLKAAQVGWSRERIIIYMWWESWGVSILRRRKFR